MKAQGLQLSTIILAILGLIVLVIVAVMMSGQFSIFGKGTKCPGGACQSESYCVNDMQYERVVLGTLGCEKTGTEQKVCCKETRLVT